MTRHITSVKGNRLFRCSNWWAVVEGMVYEGSEWHVLGLRVYSRMTTRAATCLDTALYSLEELSQYKPLMTQESLAAWTAEMSAILASLGRKPGDTG